MAGQAFFLFTSLPSEILLNVMKRMGVRDLTNFAMTNKRHCGIFQENQVTLMTNVLLGQPEFESILYVHTLGKIDFTHVMLYPRNIYFNPNREDGKIIHFTRFPVSFHEGKLICPRKIEFELQDLSAIWNMVMAIDCGPVIPYMPKLWQTDDRLHHIRRLSTIEIRELDGLWAIIESTVRRDVCTDMGPEMNPGSLKAVLEKRPRTNKSGIMQMARCLQQHLSADQEVLSATIDAVLQERLLLQCYSIDELPSSGILDEESYVGEDDDAFRTDGWPTGNPPLSKQEIAMYPPEPTHPVPYGDDAHEC
ncbi:hypothetical protein PG994_002184 [Apiospora phragmitis]|uniref:F-box domain-containing protein n=1 Tax=Apiospora phragmitis TaxID=2905665 RepID=A0ABR1WVP1_9PEZI